MKNTGHHNKESGTAKAVINDLEALKEDSLDLAKSLQVKSETAVADALDEIRQAGEDQVARLEKRVVKNPRNTVLLAFAAGALTSFLFAPRR